MHRNSKVDRERVHSSQNEGIQPRQSQVSNLSPITRRRIQRFKSIKRGYYSLWILAFAIYLSFFAELLMNSRALAVRFEGAWYFPTFHFYSGRAFGEDYESEANYRELKKKFEVSGHNYVLLPPIPYNPYENDFALQGNPPYAPDSRHLLGTDSSGRDVLVRLFYGFRIAIIFAILLTVSGYFIGTVIGAVMGYFGGWVDLLTQRAIEIWSTMPFLYLCIIIASIFEPTFMILLGILLLFSWINMTYYIRTEVYREKAKDYAVAAKSMGAGHLRIIMRHLLPNSLVPLVSYFPFSVVGGIYSLTALDFLGYGLPPPTPSWGDLLNQGLENAMNAPWITAATFTALVVTLLLITFIGEAVREAFDPRQFSRYK
ncbi:MAG: ABC transporter permease [Deltaproteobacteria bacterium]|nr:ABC transporter permease [Deltaproteobacteria bacterium]